MAARLPAEKPGSPIAKNSDRRSNKPLMEKKRRARINQSLLILKGLILDSIKLENTKHSKLEKADILELTVRYLRTLQEQNKARIESSTEDEELNSLVLEKFRAGFEECTKEVTRFLDSSGNLDPTSKQKLIQHLHTCIADLQSPDGVATSEDLVSQAARQAQLHLTATSVGTQTSLAVSTANVFLAEDMNNNMLTGQVNSTAEVPDKSGEETGDSSESISVSAMGTASPGVSPLLCWSSINGLPLLPTRLANGQVILLFPASYVGTTPDTNVMMATGLASLVSQSNDSSDGKNEKRSQQSSNDFYSDEPLDEPLDCSKKSQNYSSNVQESQNGQEPLAFDVNNARDEIVWRPW